MNMEEFLASCGPVIKITDFIDKPDWMIEQKALIGKKVIYSDDIESHLFIGFYEDKFDYYYGLKDDKGEIHYASCVGEIKEV
jgi:hypothetical protein